MGEHSVWQWTAAAGAAASLWTAGIYVFWRSGRLRDILPFSFVFGWSAYILAAKWMGSEAITVMDVIRLFVPVGRWVERSVIGTPSDPGQE